MALKFHQRHRPVVEHSAIVESVPTSSCPATSGSETLDAAEPHPELQRRFVRLAEIDRLHAESRVPFCNARRTSDPAIDWLVNLGHLQSTITAIPLAIADVVMMWLVLLAATNIAEFLLSAKLEFAVHQSWRLASFLMLPLCLSAGHYPGFGLSPMVEFRQVVRSACVAVLIYLGIGLFCLTNYWDFYLFSAVIAWGLAIPCCPISRFVTRVLWSRLPFWGAPTLIHATPQVAADLYDRLKGSLDGGLRPVGVLLLPEDYRQTRGEFIAAGIPVYEVRDALRIARKTRSTWLLISDDLLAPSSRPLEPQLYSFPHRVVLSTAHMEMGLWDRVCAVGSSCGIHSTGVRPSGMKLALKRLIDLAIAATVLVAGAPVLAAVCAIIRYSSAGPVFYGQRRVGKGGVEFTAWKFRTMVENADRVLEDYLNSDPAFRREWEETHKLRHDPRITTIGRILRQYSLDELPQLWNVLVGEMSLIGPRPIVDSPSYDRCYITEYPHEYEVYKSVRPGLSGLWQVSARNGNVYEMRIFWDVYYVRNWSLWIDAYIILRTIRTLVLREGAY